MSQFVDSEPSFQLQNLILAPIHYHHVTCSSQIGFPQKYSIYYSQLKMLKIFQCTVFFPTENRYLGFAVKISWGTKLLLLQEKIISAERSADLDMLQVIRGKPRGLIWLEVRGSTPGLHLQSAQEVRLWTNKRTGSDWLGTSLQVERWEVWLKLGSCIHFRERRFYDTGRQLLPSSARSHSLCNVITF